MLRYKNSCIISISFQEFGATHSTHANTHMKGINFTLNLLQSFIYNPPPPSLKGEHSLNMAVLSKTYKYILYNKQSFESRQHSSLVSIEIPSITISLFSIFVNTSVNSQQIFKFIWVGLFQLCGIRQQMGRQIQHSQIHCQSFAAEFEQKSGKQEMLNWQTEEGLPFPRVSIMLFDYVCTLN